MPRGQQVSARAAAASLLAGLGAWRRCWRSARRSPRWILGTARSLAEVLGQCSSLATLDLGANDIGAEGAGSLAGVLGQCLSLTKLDLGQVCGDDGRGLVVE